MRSAAAAIVAGFLSSGVSSAPANTNTEPKVRELFELAGIFIENIATRSNGNLLLNTIGQGQIYSFNPSDPALGPQPIAQVEGISALTGIAEVGHDIFAVTGAVFDPAAGTFELGTTKVALVNFRNCGKSTDGAPSVEVIVEGAEHTIWNGLTPLPLHQHVILAAASGTGEIWRIDTATGETEVAFYDDKLAPGPTGPFALGVNGIEIHDGYLYYTNTRQQTFGRFKIDEFGNKLGDAEVITRVANSTTVGPDDFVLGKNGEAYITYWPNMIIKVTPDGEETVVVNSTLVSPTSTTFGKNGNLYVVTAGQSTDPVTGGQLVEVEL